MPTFFPTVEATASVMIDGGVVDAMATHGIWAQMGTIGVEGTEVLDATVSARRPDVRFVDAPLSGSRGPAETGQLLVLASGPKSTFLSLDPIFDVIGRRTLWLGSAGMGSRLKLLLNTWLAFEVEAAAEGSALASRLGVTPKMLADALETNPVTSPLAFAKLSKIEATEHGADFSLQWALKDLELMRASGGARQAPIALAIAERWRGLVDRGFGALDVSAARFDLTEQVPVVSGTCPLTETAITSEAAGS